MQQGALRHMMPRRPSFALTCLPNCKLTSNFLLACPCPPKPSACSLLLKRMFGADGQVVLRSLSVEPAPTFPETHLQFESESSHATPCKRVGSAEAPTLLSHPLHRWQMDLWVDNLVQKLPIAHGQQQLKAAVARFSICEALTAAGCRPTQRGQFTELLDLA